MNLILLTTLAMLFLLLLLAGAPVALALGGSATLVLFGFLPPSQYLSLPMTMSGATDSHVLLAIPFFVLAGTILARSTLSVRLVALAALLTRGSRGGLGIAMIVAGVFLAGISGSGPADVAILGTVMCFR